MAQIVITLFANRQAQLENIGDTSIIAGENQATQITVRFPTNYENYSKRVDLLNERGEKWTEPLYAPEDERNQYQDDFNKSLFLFTLPDAVTIEGELLIQFIAYRPDDDTFIPFDMIRLSVKESVDYARKRAKRNPDLVVKAYEYSNIALATARDCSAKIDAMEEIGGGGITELPTDQGADKFLSGDGTYKKLNELANSKGGASATIGTDTSNDIFIKRLDGVNQQTIQASSSQLEIKSLNTTSNRYGSVLVYSTGMVKIQASTGTTTDTLEIINGNLRFNGKKVMVEE